MVCGTATFHKGLFKHEHNFASLTNNDFAYVLRNVRKVHVNYGKF